MKNILFILFCALLFSSCEKEIDLQLDDKSGTIVIEGNITDQQGPYYVHITRSVAFTEDNQYPAITDAIVTISDNAGQSETLQYEGDGRYKTSSLVSSPGNTYTLNVLIDGVNYTAQSTMPSPVTLDGLIQDSITIAGETTYNILPVYTDPSFLGNRYLFILTIDGKTDKTLQVFSDNINNGMVNQRTIMPSLDDDDEIVPGDIINVEMQCIDQNIYTYYSALIQISGGGGPGGSVTPANPPSNINNGALGYFSAHTTASKSMVIQ